MDEKRFKLGDSLVHYPVRSVVEGYPNYIEDDGKQITLPEITQILNEQEKKLTGKARRYEEKYDGDINFIMRDKVEIYDIYFILDLLNHNDKAIKEYQKRIKERITGK